MVQNHSWDANRFAVSQEIPHTLGNPKVHYRIHKSRHLSISWASSIQSIPPHPTSWRSILILSSHLWLGLSSGLFPSGFLTKTLFTPLPFPYALHALPISFFSILSSAQYWVRSTDYSAPRYVTKEILRRNTEPSIHVSSRRLTKLNTHTKELELNLIEITNKMRPCSRIYYSNVS